MKKEDELEERYDCPKCLGVGEVLPRGSHFGTEICPKCFGKKTLDWIEMIMGVSLYNDKFVLPRVRKLYPKLIAEELAGVSPIEIPQVNKENKE